MCAGTCSFRASLGGAAVALLGDREVMDIAHPAKKGVLPQGSRDRGRGCYWCSEERWGGHESCGTVGNWQPQWKTSVWLILILAKEGMGGLLGDGACGREEQPQPAGPGRHTASQRARQASPHAHAHPVYLRDRRAVPLTGGGLMHHPLGKEFFQAHVIIQDHLQERALGGGGRDDMLSKEDGLVGGRLASSQRFLEQHHLPTPQP